ncbi:MAG TPA: DJ-1/PfpI family protein [Steroidobacteraceae bacterium]|jgi:cyclohexyl-isocyanide hydratase|nr:DJ-1/PfpI family protein [Steroidobacteraceae bacterium]
MAKSFEVVFALYPRITQLDFTGPYEVFSRLPGARCTLASTGGGTIQAEGGLAFANVVPLASVQQCALLCVPGGFGTVQALDDREYLSQLRRLASCARYVTSVCTGSLLLAAAGLLRGKRAACHWAWRHLLTEFGVQPDPARIVRVGRTITGGGVTAGIDMALTVVAEIAGAASAQALQLGIEYAPEPPFDCGRPERAPAAVLAAARQRLETVSADRDIAVRRAAQLDLAAT